MKKRLFQVLDEMNVNDEINKTATCACCFDNVSARTAQGGGHVTMGVPAEVITKIMLGGYKPMLVLLDMTEYHRLEAIPMEDKAQQRIEQLEKALSYISTFAKTSETNIAEGEPAIAVAYDLMIEQARDALTPKTTTDEPVK